MSFGHVSPAIAGERYSNTCAMRRGWRPTCVRSPR